jgi:hypothetical protein
MSQSAHPNHCKGTCDLTIDSEWGSTPAQGIIPFWENSSRGRDRTLPARLVFALGGTNLVCTHIESTIHIVKLHCDDIIRATRAIAKLGP